MSQCPHDLEDGFGRCTLEEGHEGLHRYPPISVYDLGSFGTALLDEKLGEVTAERDALRAEVERLKQRQSELLEALAKVSRENPYPDEVRDWQSQRAKLIAEVGSLRSGLAEAQALISRLRGVLDSDIHLIEEHKASAEAFRARAAPAIALEKAVLAWRAHAPGVSMPANVLAAIAVALERAAKAERELERGYAHGCTHLVPGCCAERKVCSHGVCCTHGACCFRCWEERCPENATERAAKDRTNPFGPDGRHSGKGSHT